ncbi:MAG: class I SAM-dependent methyltransferase [Clostridiales bacterium]|jgi:ubiquinone/menaquinone biosynthesis C-methylase UbiE|nr:class I SAM-dependent methyltransferase [Clostridiales bacterium]
MGTNCHYIRTWDKERLYEMVDFRNKVVLDVGAGSGRLTFAAAVLAKEVYASEPVETMREFIRNKAKREGVANIRVAEALVTSIPYPDNSFDIVMSGHVVGDDWDAEIAELTRVCKSGGWLLDCPGDETDNYDRGEQHNPLVQRGWEEMRYVGNGGGNVYRYRKQIWKG